MFNDNKRTSRTWSSKSNKRPKQGAPQLLPNLRKIYKKKDLKELVRLSWELRAELRVKSKGMVLTDIDLPFGRVFWVTVQFFVAGLIIAIPIWIILMVIIYN